MTSSQDGLRSHRALIAACLANGVPFFWQGPGTMLISGSGVGAVLRDVAAAGERVLGLDGFELDSSVIHPRLDLIFDPSRGPVRDPVSVVDEWGHDVWVDVTLGTAAGT